MDQDDVFFRKAQRGFLHPPMDDCVPARLHDSLCGMPNLTLKHMSHFVRDYVAEEPGRGRPQASPDPVVENPGGFIRERNGVSEGVRMVVEWCDRLQLNSDVTNITTPMELDSDVSKDLRCDRLRL